MPSGIGFRFSLASSNSSDQVNFNNNSNTQHVRMQLFTACLLPDLNKRAWHYLSYHTGGNFYHQNIHALEKLIQIVTNNLHTNNNHFENDGSDWHL